MNIDKLKNIIRDKSKGNNNVALQLYQMYFFEHILERLSISKYKNNIILKGGLLLSSIIGDNERTTKDMDATLKSIPLERDNVEEIINEILNININDNIKYEIVDIKDIRQESEYGGFKVNILAIMSSLKIRVSLELTTGDRITPREIKYNYNCVFENKKIPIFAYNLETLMAEKYQTIIDRDIYNTRMKDFYDIYKLIEENKEIINFENLVLAIRNTFNYRNTELNISDIKKQLKNMKTSSELKRLWEKYNQTSPYSNEIKFEDLFNSLEYITDIVSEEEVVVA